MIPGNIIRSSKLLDSFKYIQTSIVMKGHAAEDFARFAYLQHVYWVWGRYKSGGHTATDATELLHDFPLALYIFSRCRHSMTA